MARPYLVESTVSEVLAHGSGVPFALGTEVQVIIKPTENGGPAAAAPAADRAARLFAALDTARNTEPIGPLR